MKKKEKKEEEGKEEGLRTHLHCHVRAQTGHTSMGVSAHSHGWDSERLLARSMGCEVGLRALVVKTS